MKTWYSYIIVFEDGTFYFGYRGTKNNPNDDFLITYFTSSKEVKHRLLSKEPCYASIIFQSVNKEEAYIYEQNNILQHWGDHRLLNKSCYYHRIGWGLLSDEAKQKNK